MGFAFTWDSEKSLEKGEERERERERETFL
jgi:hypothetical protein